MAGQFRTGLAAALECGKYYHLERPVYFSSIQVQAVLQVRSPYTPGFARSSAIMLTIPIIKYLLLDLGACGLWNGSDSYPRKIHLAGKLVRVHQLADHVHINGR